MKNDQENKFDNVWETPRIDVLNVSVETKDSILDNYDGGDGNS